MREIDLWTEISEYLIAWNVSIDLWNYSEVFAVAGAYGRDYKREYTQQYITN